MANLCSYVFKWVGPPKPLDDPKGFNTCNDDVRTIGTRKWGPPTELLSALSATGRLDWEEHGLLGLGYVIMKDGVIQEEVTVPTPQTIEECKKLMEAHPTLDVQNLIELYEEEERSDLHQEWQDCNWYTHEKLAKRD